MTKGSLWKIAALALGVFAAGCGGGDDDDTGSDSGTTDQAAAEWAAIPTTTDINGGNVYVNTRDMPMPVDYGCLGMADNTPGSVLTTLTVNGTLFDFQNSTTPVVAATVDVWNDISKLGMAPDATATTDGQGKFTITVPGVSGKKRLHWRSRKTGETFDTFELADPFDFSAAAPMTQTLNRNSVSIFTGGALPALAGITRKAGTGVIAGSLRDCNRKEVGNAIATVLGSDDKPIPGIKVVYMSDQNLPRRRDPSIRHSLATNAKNGIFIVVDVPPSTGTVKMVAEGNVNGVRTRLAEFSAPVFADSVVVVDADPKR